MSQHRSFPTYLLRIPWYILLEHLERFPEKYVKRKSSGDTLPEVGFKHLTITESLPADEQAEYAEFGITYPLAPRDKIRKIAKTKSSLETLVVCHAIGKKINYEGGKYEDIQNRLNAELALLAKPSAPQPETIRLDSKTLDGLYHYVQAIVDDKEGEWDNRAALKEEFAKILNIYDNWRKKEALLSPYQLTVKEQKKVWNAENPYYDILSESLNDSTWCMYERTDAHNHAAE